MATDLDLHLPSAPASLAPEMTLRRSDRAVDTGWAPEPGDLLARVLDEDRGVGYLAARTSGGYRLRFDDLCDFDLSEDLSAVTWQTLPGRDPGLVSVLAAGALMAFRLIMAGHLVLHASAVHIRGRGLAFVGRSGMGKSTMATLMCAVGGSLLTDDVARVDIEGGRALLWPGGAESRLRPAATSLTKLLSSENVTRATSDGRTAVFLPSCREGPVALDAVVVPVPSRQQKELQLEAQSPGFALILLNEFPRIPGWIDTDVQDRQFNRFADLVERVPVYVATIPWGHRFEQTPVPSCSTSWSGPTTSRRGPAAGTARNRGR